MQRDIFVSYAQADKECAFAIVAQLESCGISVWVAPRDVQPSADWAAEIIDAIAATRVMVLVFSAASNGSAQVRREVERAVHRQRPILPFRVEDVLPTKGMEYFLSSQHWLDAFPPPLAPHYERLCEQVTRMLREAHPVETSTQAIFSRETLQRLQANLAEHIGPMAAFLVSRAAAVAVDRDALVNALATEIDSDAARQRFIETSRR
jgi:TIR domain-containing protein